MPDPTVVVKPSVAATVEADAKKVEGAVAGAAEAAVSKNPKTMLYVIAGLVAVVAAGVALVHFGVL